MTLPQPTSAQGDERAGSDERVSLRDALGAAPLPDFALALPEGWGRVPTDGDGLALLEKRLSSRMMQANRMDLMIGFRSMLRESFASMREWGAVAVFLPLDPEGLGQTGTATSITAFLRKGEPDMSLDAYVQHAIQRFSAEPLYGDLRTVRFETETRKELDEQEVVLSTTHYVTPIPGTRRQRAVELLATYGRPASMPRDDERVVALHVLFDLCASSLRWAAPTS